MAGAPPRRHREAAAANRAPQGKGASLMATSTNADPHRDQPVRHFGEPLDRAQGVVILLHGRGGSAEDILSLAESLYRPQLAYLAPQAAGHTWYPNSFLAPIEQNQPWLDSALR